MEIILREFSVVLPEPKNKSESCGVCYNNFIKGDIMTTVPICRHQFHYECFQLWIKTQYMCPCCKCIIRKNMIEHFHGCYKIEEEGGKKIRKPDQDIIIEITNSLSKNRVDDRLVKPASEC